jgi:hypothetical protein
MAVRLGEQRDGAQRCAVFLIELAGRVDETHGGFAAIHDRHALEFEVHKSSDRQRSSRHQATRNHAATVSNDIAACSASIARHQRRWEPPLCGSR